MSKNQEISVQSCSIMFNHISRSSKQMNLNVVFCISVYMYIYIIIYPYYSLNNLNIFRTSKRQRCLPEIMGSAMVRLAAGNVHPPWAWDPGPWWFAMCLWMSQKSPKMLELSCDQIWSKPMNIVIKYDKILFLLFFGATLKLKIPYDSTYPSWFIGRLLRWETGHAAPF